ncbi:MAG: hypothetical protein FJ352_03850 [Firmicutes bacterium]|nr:hypothetical protein [Bacillota bacterium]
MYFDFEDSSEESSFFDWELDTDMNEDFQIWEEELYQMHQREESRSFWSQVYDNILIIINKIKNNIML